MVKQLVLGLGVVVGLLVLPQAGHAAVLSLFPERQAPYVNETVRLDLGIDTEGERVNVVDAMVLIPQGVRVLRVETGGSIVDMWLGTPGVEEESGAVRLTGAITGGFAGRGFIASLIIAAEAAGNYPFLLDETSLAFLHDGEGTPAKTIREGLWLTVEERSRSLPEVRSATHPDGVWSANTEAAIEWEVKPEAVYSWTFDIEPETVPDTVPEEVVSPIVFQGRGDGMHYFHLREGIPAPDGYRWGGTVHYRVLVDTTPPKPFEPVSVAPDTIAVPARDENAGIRMIEYRWQSLGILRGGPKQAELAEPVPVPVFVRWFGGTLTVRAIDGAGNAREYPVSVAGSWGVRGAALVVLALVLIGIVGFVRRSARR